MIKYRSVPQFAPTDLRLFRVFQAVVRNAGFASAQDELGISAATISNHIIQLEARLGVRLCERGRKGFSLTPEGSRVHEASQNLLRSVENFSGILSSVRGELAGTIHFGTADAMYTNPHLKLAQAIARFNQVAPKVEIRLEVASPQDLQQRLLDGRYGLILTPMENAHPSINAEALFEEEQSLCCGKVHNLFERRPDDISTIDLQGSAFAARSYAKELAGPPHFNFHIAAQSAHMESLAILILSGRYLGYLPTHFAESFIDQGSMRRLWPEETCYFDTFYLAHRRDENNRATKILREIVSECVSPRTTAKGKSEAC